MYQVLARKWRPQSLGELIGQPHVVRTLGNALATGRLAHAYVFAGLRGTGKTTVARILAKSLNCATGPTATPCNRCTPCVEITEGRALDVMELDAASRTGVDNIRELQEVVAYAPVRDRNKVLIIDEAHMLSKAAFNALLKTLEEPPPRVVFVLATTEMQKLLPTILSRCQVFEFRRLAVRELAAHLRRVADAEGIEISDRTLDRLARAGEGSVRDALSVLERVLAFCGSSVADEEALQVLGAVRTEVLDAFVRAIAARDAGALLTALDGVVDEGHDLVHFWSELIGVVRDLLLLRTWPSGADVLSRSPEESAALAEAGAPLSVEDWTRVFQILAALEPGLKSSSQPRFLFEGTLIRIAGLGAVRPIEELIASIGAVADGVPPPPPPRPARVVSEPQKKNGADAFAPRLTAGDGAKELREAVVASVAASRPMLAAMLEQASGIVLDGGALVARFGAAADGVRRMLGGDDNVRAIEGLVSASIGRKVTLRLAADDAGPAPGDVPPDDAGRPAPARPTSSPGVPPRSPGADTGARAALMDRARGDAAVRRLLDEFGAQIVDVRPHVEPAGSDEPNASAEESA